MKSCSLLSELVVNLFPELLRIRSGESKVGVDPWSGDTGNHSPLLSKVLNPGLSLTTVWLEPEKELSFGPWCLKVWFLLKVWVFIDPVSLPPNPELGKCFSLYVTTISLIGDPGMQSVVREFFRIPLGFTSRRVPYIKVSGGITILGSGSGGSTYSIISYSRVSRSVCWVERTLEERETCILYDLYIRPSTIRITPTRPRDTARIRDITIFSWLFFTKELGSSLTISWGSGVSFSFFSSYSACLIISGSNFTPVVEVVWK